MLSENSPKDTKLKNVFVPTQLSILVFLKKEKREGIENNISKQSLPHTILSPKRMSPFMLLYHRTHPATTER